MFQNWNMPRHSTASQHMSVSPGVGGGGDLAWLKLHWVYPGKVNKYLLGFEPIRKSIYFTWSGCTTHQWSVISQRCCVGGDTLYLRKSQTLPHLPFQVRWGCYQADASTSYRRSHLNSEEKVNTFHFLHIFIISLFALYIHLFFFYII